MHLLRWRALQVETAEFNHDPFVFQSQEAVSALQDMLLGIQENGSPETPILRQGTRS